MFNHGLMGQRSLEDVVGIFGHQLRALGHEIVWDPRNDRFLSGSEGYNLIVEGFTPDSVAAIAEGYNNGAKFLILATEEPTPKGFNHGTQKEMVMRQETFKDGAQFADGIFHLVPGGYTAKWYSQFAPTAYVELGFARSLVRPDDGREPIYDFGFFGSLSKRRLKILRKLAQYTGKQNAVRVVADFPDQTSRDHAMREAKVILQLRKFDEMGLVSSSRCNTALCLGRPVVAEPHDLSKPWDSIVHFSKSMENFYGEALAVCAVWRNVHAGQFRKFKEILPPERCVGEPLAFVLAENERRRRAA